MVAKTWYMTNNLAGTAHQEMSETDPGTEANASPQTGWVVSTGATNHASMDAQSNVAAASFTATTQPDGTPVTTAGAGDCLRSTNPYTGNFASGNWVFSFCFRGVTQAGAQDGRVRFRLLKGADPTGAGATDISGSQQQASLVTNLLTTPTQTSTLTVNPGAFEVSNEYIFVQVAWERTGAGGMTTTDVAFRIGNASGAGTRVVSADFTPTAPRTDPPDKTGLLTQPPAYLRTFGAGVVSLSLLASAGQSYVPSPPVEEESPQFNFAMVTNSVPLRRTLFYQANIAPVPLEIPVDNINASASTTTGAVRSKTLFYQARIEPPVQLALDNTGTLPTWHVQLSRAPPLPRAKTALYTSFVPLAAPQPAVDTWLVPLSRAAPRPPVYSAQYTPFVPAEATRQNTVTPDAWMVPLSRAVPIPRVAQPTQPAYGYPYEAADNTRTEWDWSVAWQGPPRYVPPRIAAQPFVPREAVLENTVTPDAWMPSWRGPPRTLLGLAGGVVYPPQGMAEVNTRTEWDWQISWQGPPRYKLTLPGGAPFVPKEATSENTPSGTGWKLTGDGHGAFPRRPVAPAGGQPFIPREATVENTVATGWHQPFYKAVPPPRLNLSQPVYGFPYEGIDNSRSEWDWHTQWPGPPRRLLGLPGGQPFVAKQFVEDVHGPEKWLQAFRAPPRYWPLKVQAIPFVPREATRDNTVTPDAWHRDLGRAAPRPPVSHTQPVLGYPYESIIIAVPYEQWWHQPLSRAAPRPAVHSKPYQPFVPREATRENTQTPDKWLQRWQGPPRITPIQKQTPPFVPPAAAPVTPDKWHRDLGRAAARTAVTHTQPGWSYAPAVEDNTVTVEKWQQPLSVAVAAPKPRLTQPLYVTITPEAAAEEFNLAQVSGAARYRKTLFYQALVQPYYPYEQAGLVVQQQVQVRLTVAFHRMLRYSCKAETQDRFEVICEGEAFPSDAFQNDAFQICPDEISGDPWATQGEATGGFADVTCEAFASGAFQSDAYQTECVDETSEESDPWTTQAEAADPWGEQTQSPSGPGCDECR